jgi:hypothetical protein
MSEVSKLLEWSADRMKKRFDELRGGNVGGSFSPMNFDYFSSSYPLLSAGQIGFFPSFLHHLLLTK